ncbi:MAG: TolC family protein [Cyclobacteriaceae bacterium]|nr:TolC family protein [Cyclobacteriaceae bacterium]MCH8516018.1 TolC family protein [Cyclobacteriaceae bacterium]
MFSPLSSSNMSMILDKYSMVKHYVLGILIIFFLFSPDKAFSQLNNADSVNASVDSDSTLLDWDTYVDWIALYHPVARQANLQEVFGRENLRAARGGFDPIIYGKYNEKVFGGSDYYTYQDYGVLIPTFGGVEIMAGYEIADGQFLNPERVVPGAGLFSAGVRVNLGEGLLIDVRRKVLNQARLFEKETEENKRLILNDLYLQAAHIYWNWALANYNYQALREGLDVAIDQFEGIRSAYFAGELPAIDTVESFAQVQNIDFRLKQLEQEVYQRRMDLSTFTWAANNEPIFVDANVKPEPLNSTANNDILINTEEELYAELNQHPMLRRMDLQIQQMQQERRWKVEQLKPKVFLQYNFINESFGVSENMGFLQNNYTAGFGFSTPLFLRRERGNLRFFDAQMQEFSFDIGNQRAKLTANLGADLNTLEVQQQQIRVFTSNVNNLALLLQAEKTRFDNGESSIFLINARETSLIDAKLVLNRVKSQYQISKARLKQSAGVAYKDFIVQEEDE